MMLIEFITNNTNQMKNTKSNQTIQQRIAQWDTKTIVETITNYKRTIAQYTPRERDSHYKRLKNTLSVLQAELATR
jgi:hypothetical protein